jgi:hypothetical protein
MSPPQPLWLAELVQREIGSRRRIEPAVANRLGRVLTKERLEAVAATERKQLLDGLADATFEMADGTWRTAALPPRDAADADEEERRILAFAPDRVVAVSAYAGLALAVYRLARQQSGFQQTAREFAVWAQSEEEPERQKAFLRYMLEGRQGPELADELAERRPSWLPETSDQLRESPLVEGWDNAKLVELLSRLYKEENERRWQSEMPPPGPGATADEGAHVDPSEYLSRACDWWQTNHQEERWRHDDTAYPDGFRPTSLRGSEASDDREGWFTFFALGIFRTIGRSHEGQHRSFITGARRVGWWQEMAQARLPDDPGPWIRRLEDLARADAWRIDFLQWRRALSDLYVLARWLPEYVDAFRNLPGLVRQRGRIQLSEAWRLGTSELWQRRGLEGAPLTQSLGLGANWLIREAIRHGIWPEADRLALHPHAWGATARMRRLFTEKLGHPLEDSASMDSAPTIHRIVTKYLGDRADFLGDLDLPLQILADGRRDVPSIGGLHAAVPVGDVSNRDWDEGEWVE